MILMGPGLGFYSAKTEIGTSMDPEKEAEFFQKLNDVLADRIPGYDKVIEAADFSKTSSFDTQGLGFRYVVRVGYRF